MRFIENIKFFEKTRIHPLVKIGGTVFLAVTLYESIKQIVFPTLSIWQSHFITIVFCSFSAVVAGYFGLKRYEIVNKSLQNKIKENNKLSKTLTDKITELEQSKKDYIFLTENINVGMFVNGQNK